MEIPSNDFTLKNKLAQDKVGQKQAIQKMAGEAAASQAAKSSSQGGSSAEQVSLSSKARDIQRAHDVIRSAPEVRTEKVSRIKKEIAEGKFKVESDKVAEKILTDIITQSSFLG